MPALVGPIDVGHERHPVAHLDAYARIDRDPVGPERRRRRRQRPAGQPEAATASATDARRHLASVPCPSRLTSSQRLGSFCAASSRTSRIWRSQRSQLCTPGTCGIRGRSVFSSSSAGQGVVLPHELVLGPAVEVQVRQACDCARRTSPARARRGRSPRGWGCRGARRHAGWTARRDASPRRPSRCSAPRPRARSSRPRTRTRRGA